MTTSRPSLAASPASRMRPSVRWAVNLGWASWCVIAATELLIVFYDVEIVIFAGPIICAIALAGIILAIRGKYPPLALLGTAHIAVSLLFVGLVNTLSWSPSEAERPFAVMGGVYALGSFAWTWQLARRAPRVRDPGRCANCGYLLFGLSVPRCPECGQPFDPAETASDPQK